MLNTSTGCRARSASTRNRVSSTRALPNANEPAGATDAATQAAAAHDVPSTYAADYIAAPGASTQASTAEPRPPTAAAATAAATQASTAAATQSAATAASGAGAIRGAQRIYRDRYGRPGVTCDGCWQCFFFRRGHC